MIHLLLGIGLLLPWNAYITADDYYESLWSGNNFTFWLSIAYNYPAIVFLLLNIRYGRSFPFGSRIFIGFTCLSACVVFVPIITSVYGADASDSEKHISFWATLAAVFLSGCFASMLFGTVLGMASVFPMTMITAVMSGNGIAGVLVGLLRIVTKLAFPNTIDGLRNSSIVYFVLAAAILAVCAFSFVLLLKNQFGVYYLALNVKSCKPTSLDLEPEDKMMLPADAENEPQKVGYWVVFKKLWLEALEVFWVFFVTLTIFPGLTLQIPSQFGPQFDAWFGILLIFDFQVFDYVGRTCPRWLMFFSRKTLWIPVVLRSAFVILFLMCIPPMRIITIDGFPYLFMALFAWTNGYCGTLAMMFGPTRVEDHEKETAGAIMSFALNLGIWAAVQFAVLVDYLIVQDQKDHGLD